MAAPSSDIRVMERRLRRLERLQHMTTSFERAAKSMNVKQQQLPLSAAVEKSLELRQSPASSFATQLRLSRQLTNRESKVDAAALLLRIRDRSSKAEVVRKLGGGGMAEQATKIAQPQIQTADQAAPAATTPNKTVDNGANTALVNLRKILDEQKRRHIVKRQRLEEIREANAAADRAPLVVPADGRKSICSTSNKTDDISIITDPTCFEPRDSFEVLADEQDDVSLMNQETIEFDVKDKEDPFADPFELTESSFTVKGGSVSSSSKEEEEEASSSSMSGKETDGSYSGKEDSITAATAEWTDVSSESDESRRSKLEDMKDRVKALEKERLQRAESLSSVLSDYRSRAAQLEEEKKFLKDAKETTYSEMKSLLVEQSQESEYLRHRLHTLENKSKKTKTFGTLFFFLFVAAAVFSACGLVQRDTAPTTASQQGNAWNVVCAPVQPGAQVTEDTGVLEAPWWAPEGVKQPLYHLAGCGSRPRMSMEVKKGFVRVTSGDELYMKKRGNSVYVESDTLQIVDRWGKHLETVAPWVLN